MVEGHKSIRLGGLVYSSQVVEDTVDHPDVTWQSASPAAVDTRNCPIAVIPVTLVGHPRTLAMGRANRQRSRIARDFLPVPELTLAVWQVV